jgi:hypothetical protein
LSALGNEETTNQNNNNNVFLYFPPRLLVVPHTGISRERIYGGERTNGTTRRQYYHG